MAELNSLLETALRKDPKKAKEQKAAEIRTFLESRGAERTAKLGESTGLGDLLSFLPAAGAAKALGAGQKGLSAVNALAFTSQFDDSKLGQEVGDITALIPGFGKGSARGMAGAQERLQKYLEQVGVGTAVNSAANALGPKKEGSEEQMAVVPSWRKKLRYPMRQHSAEELQNKARHELVPQKLTDNDKFLKQFPNTNPNKSSLTGFFGLDSGRSAGQWSNRTKNLNYLVNGDPKAGLSVKRASLKFPDASKDIELDVHGRPNFEEIRKREENLVNYEKLKDDRDRAIENYRKDPSGGFSNLPEWPEYPFTNYAKEAKTKFDPKSIKVLSQLMAARYPEAQRVSGTRVTGVRENLKMHNQKTEVSLPKLPEYKAMKLRQDATKWLDERVNERKTKSFKRQYEDMDKLSDDTYR